MNLLICPYSENGECDSSTVSCIHAGPHKKDANCIISHKREICPNCIESMFESNFIKEEEMEL